MSKKPDCFGKIMNTGDVVYETDCKTCKQMEDCIREYDRGAYEIYDEEEEEYPDEDEDFEDFEFRG